MTKKSEICVEMPKLGQFYLFGFIEWHLQFISSNTFQICVFFVGMSGM